MSNLHVPHFSLGKYSIPVGMTEIKLQLEVSDRLTNIALEIFTDMSNHGKGFTDALLAVYLSGLEHGSNLNNENK